VWGRRVSRSSWLIACEPLVLATPGINDPPDVLVDYLRTIAAAIRLFAAVDGEGIVRATS